MNDEDKIYSSSSRSSEIENDSSRNSSSNGHRASERRRDKREEVVNSTNSDTKSKSSRSSISSTRQDEEGLSKLNEVPHHSDSGDSGERDVELSSSISTESDKELPRIIPTDSSSVVTDIDIISPKDGKSSSSTDEELLRKFREQQANRRYRPKSAKVKYKRVVEPETEITQKYNSRGSDKEDSRSSSTSDSLLQGRSDSSQKKSDGKTLQKRPASSSSKNSIRQQKLKRSQSSSSSDRSTETEENPETKKHPQSSKSTSSRSSSTSTEDKAVVAQQLRRPKPDVEEPKHSRRSGDSRKHIPEVRPSQIEERPPSRQGRRKEPPQSKRTGRTRTRSKPEKGNLDELLRKKSKPLPTNPRENWPKEPGFWWPYNEDRGERELQNLISYHRRKLNNLLAQEYLQRHLEIELKRVGAQFTRYDRPPRSLSPKQVRKYKERDISWIYLDGNLYNLQTDSMGMLMAKGKSDRQVQPRKTRSASRSLERSSKSSERSKRSVSFEKGTGRKRSTDKKRGKKGRKAKRSSSSKDSRKSSLSSRESSRQSRDSSRSSKMEYGRGERTKSRSRSRSWSSSRSSNGSKKSPSKIQITGHPPRPMTALARPKTAKSKLRSLSSTSKSSAEASSGKKIKNKGSSRSRSRDSSRKSRNKTNRIDSSTELERVLFTEEFEKKLKKKENQMRKQRKEWNAKAKTAASKDTDQSDNEDQKIKAESFSINGKQRAARNDYDFYRDPNIPGHAFPHYYLAQLLSSQSTRRKKRDESAQYVLLPAPVNRPSPWKKYSYRSRRPQRKNPSVSAKTTTAPKSKGKKTKSIINQIKKEEESSGESSSSSSRSNSPAVNSHPRIRPGSGPIKCSWKEQSEQDSPKFTGSDYQLKNTDNPAILSWLKRKDAQLRARRQVEIRTQRRKTAKLIDEQNDLEDKHERALQQYEIWKKNKDREILLRRRKEAKDANSASFNRREDGPSHAKRAGHVYHHASGGGSTFSELRSSSAQPVTTEATQRRPRPKSANAAGMTVAGRDKQRPKSATLPRSDTKSHKVGSSSQTSQSLFESVLEDGASNGIRDVPDQDNEGQPIQDENKAAYNRWVRSSHSDGRKRKDRKTTKRNSSHKLPPHNHTDNELISKLAKRRIDIILANKKSVDTGLNRRPKSADVKSKAATKPSGSDPTHRKWKLREDNIIKPAVTFAPNNKGSSLSSSSSKSDEERVKFSYRMKSHASSRHERNPVVREAVDTSTTTDRSHTTPE